ncbi:MAG: DUF4173 domain-containing protein [Candidatus Peribacteraceae bacterium]|nr:DUF4173 domain-containing protein [Candidatus Peribacteraceae bacterium]MDD5742502.1 DUF4173 domain-containing protein [Candidatus Peribacteraceae bacterium]
MPTVTRPLRRAVYVGLGLALFWILAGWGIWEQGPYAMGVNYTVFTLGVALFFSVHADERPLKKTHLPWLVPILLIALSFLLYENPFVKMVNILVLVPLFVCFRVVVSTPNYERLSWNRTWIEHVLRRFFGAIGQIGIAIETIVKIVIPFGTEHIRTMSKIVMGLVIFVVLAFVIFIPLLSAADPAFAEMMRAIVDYVRSFISIEWLVRTVCFIALAIALIAIAASWNRREEVRSEGTHRSMDDIVSGVVLGGILLLYVLFLGTQLKSLWVTNLPTEFHQTEVLVKSGFWQLFALTAINVILFFVYYRRTRLRVQRLLTVFTVASILLLFSAAKRMAMYVWFYGFSYEKFFASYTVLFAIVLFGYLFWCLAQHERRDIMKVLVYGFIWMYAVASILPTEQFIFRANMWLSERSDSRINLAELQMLSADVYGLVLREQRQRPKNYWEDWFSEQKRITSKKQWYEWNVQDVKLRALNR